MYPCLTQNRKNVVVDSKQRGQILVCFKIIVVKYFSMLCYKFCFFLSLLLICIYLLWTWCFS